MNNYYWFLDESLIGEKHRSKQHTAFTCEQDAIYQTTQITSPGRKLVPAKLCCDGNIVYQYKCTCSEHCRMCTVVAEEECNWWCEEID